MSQSSGTYFSLAKWFKRASLIVLLAPLALLIMVIVRNFTTFDSEAGYAAVLWIAIGASVVWLVLQIIMFCTAGTVKGQISPLATRFWLFIALVLVCAPEIMLILPQIPSIWERIGSGDWVKWVGILMPIIVMLGYAVGASIAGSVKRQLA